MAPNRRVFRWFVASIFLLCLPFGVLTAAPIKLPYNFKYDLHVSDVHCWISKRCSGLVAHARDGRMVAALDRHLRSAQKSLDLAVYGIRRQEWLIERLEQLQDRSVEIRATIDQVTGDLGEWDVSTNFPYPDAGRLFDAIGAANLQPDRNLDGSPRTGSIMHNKFYVLDGSSVWMGSTNLSDTCASKEYNANSSIIIHSEAIAKLFADEFEQMFSEGLYGIYKHQRRRQDTFHFRDGTEVAVYFAPQDRPVDQAVIPFIRNARERLTIGIFYLTSVPVADALIDAHRRGVEIRIVTDATAARHRSSVIDTLRNARVPVRIENWGGKMHMKTAVADGRHTLIGSMNWSDAGNNANDESVVTIKDNRSLAGALERYIHSLWNTIPARQRDPRSESFDSINSCFDGINNDHQGGIDAEEPACRS